MPVCGFVPFLWSGEWNETEAQRNLKCSKCLADPRPAGKASCHLTRSYLEKLSILISSCAMGSIVSLP